MALFGKKAGKPGTTIPPACEYCSYGQHGANPRMILCEKTGVVAPTYHCRKYQYDPLERIPHRQPKLPDFSVADFSLD